MKNILKLIFLFSIIFIKSQSDENSELEIKYDFVFVNDTLDKSHPLSEQMTLLTNGKKSNYFSENYKARAAAFGRQLRGATNNEVVTINMSGVPEAKVKHSVYKDENGIFISNSLGRTLYTFKSADLKTWKIFNQDTKNILGYKCTKATIEIDNKKYIAWFTYDIPINDGPYKFRGLPGLILEVSESHEYFKFSAVSITKVKLPIEFRKGVLINKEQYINKRNEYIADPSQGKINNPEYRRRIEENKKKYNNSLE